LIFDEPAGQHIGIVEMRQIGASAAWLDTLWSRLGSGARPDDRVAFVSAPMGTHATDDRLPGGASAGQPLWRSFPGLFR
jgi:hypothetical protein